VGYQVVDSKITDYERHTKDALDSFHSKAEQTYHCSMKMCILKRRTRYHLLCMLELIITSAFSPTYQSRDQSGCTGSTHIYPRGGRGESNLR